MPNKAPMAWFEVMTNDSEVTQSFYKTLFGWEVEGMDMGEMGTYNMVKEPGAEMAFGGVFPLDDAMREAGARPAWMVYFDCDDVDAMCAKVKELGGSVHVEPFDIPNVGRTALVADPQGAAFYFFKSAHPEG